MLGAFKDGIFENDSLRKYFDNNRVAAFEALRSSILSMYYAQAEGLNRTMKSFDLTPPHHLKTDIEVACAAGRLTGMWEYVAGLYSPKESGIPDFDAFCAKTMDCAIGHTFEAMRTVKYMGERTQIQYYLNSLPIWQQMKTFPARLEQSGYPPQTVEAARALAGNIRWTAIDDALGHHATLISNAQEAWREQLKNRRAASEVTGRMAGQGPARAAGPCTVVYLSDVRAPR